MIVCFCRNISTNDYHDEETLKRRILDNDFNCGLCQTKYLLEEKNKEREVSLNSLYDRRET